MYFKDIRKSWLKFIIFRQNRYIVSVLTPTDVCGLGRHSVLLKNETSLKWFLVDPANLFSMSSCNALVFKRTTIIKFVKFLASKPVPKPFDAFVDLIPLWSVYELHLLLYHWQNHFLVEWSFDSEHFLLPGDNFLNIRALFQIINKISLRPCLFVSVGLL